MSLLIPTTNPPLPDPPGTTLFTTLTIFIILLTLSTTSLLHSLRSRRQLLLLESQTNHSNPFNPHPRPHPSFELPSDPLPPRPPFELSTERPPSELPAAEAPPNTDAILTQFPTPEDLEQGRGFGGQLSPWPGAVFGFERATVAGASALSRAGNWVRNLFPRRQRDRDCGPQQASAAPEEGTQKTVSDDDSDGDESVDVSHIYLPRGRSLSQARSEGGFERSAAPEEGTQKTGSDDDSDSDESVDVSHIYLPRGRFPSRSRSVSPAPAPMFEDELAAPSVQLAVVAPSFVPSAADQDAANRPWPPAPSAVDEDTPSPSAPEAQPASPTSPTTPLPTRQSGSFSSSWSRRSSASDTSNPPVALDFSTPQWDAPATRIESPPVSPRTVIPPRPLVPDTDSLVLGMGAWATSAPLDLALHSPAASSPPTLPPLMPGPGLGWEAAGEGETVSPLTTPSGTLSVFTVSSLEDEDEGEGGRGEDEDEDGDGDEDEGVVVGTAR